MLKEQDNLQIKKRPFALYKEAFLRKEEIDMKILRWIFVCGRYLAITPFSLYGTRCLTSLTIISLLVGQSSCICFWVAIKIRNDAAGSMIFFIVDILWGVTQGLFVLVCFLSSNVFMLNHWKEFFKKLAELEIIMRKLDFQVTRRVNLFYYEFLAFFLFFSVPHIYQHYVWIKHGLYKELQQDLIWLAADFYMLSVLLLIYSVGRVLKRRLNFINETIKSINEAEQLQESIIKKLEKLTCVYKTMYTLVKTFSAIFGWHMFFFVSIFVIYALVIIEYLMEVIQNSSFEKYIGMALYITIYVISLVILIVSCDSVEKGGKRIIKTCFLICESVENEAVKQELLLLANYAEKLRPVFSAAGFYDINQSTLSAIFQAIITYMVIIIQFNLALKE